MWQNLNRVDLFEKCYAALNVVEILSAKKTLLEGGEGTCDKPGAGKTLLYHAVFDYQHYFPPSPPPPPSYFICTKFLRNIETKKETNLLTFVVRWSAVDLCC